MIYSCIYLISLVCIDLRMDNHCHHILQYNISCLTLSMVNSTSGRVRENISSIQLLRMWGTMAIRPVPIDLMTMPLLKTM